MSFFPSFVYDQFRLGMETPAEADIWRTNRDRLEKLMHGTAKEIGASIMKRGLGGAETEETGGNATILELGREQPPMTTEEALEAGKKIVLGWQAIISVDKVPDYCDMVFQLPEKG